MASTPNASGTEVPKEPIDSHFVQPPKPAVKITLLKISVENGRMMLGRKIGNNTLGPRVYIYISIICSYSYLRILTQETHRKKKVVFCSNPI